MLPLVQIAGALAILVVYASTQFGLTDRYSRLVPILNLAAFRLCSSAVVIARGTLGWALGPRSSRIGTLVANLLAPHLRHDE
jgi:hypothetical protein